MLLSIAWHKRHCNQERRNRVKWITPLPKYLKELSLNSRFLCNSHQQVIKVKRELSTPTQALKNTFLPIIRINGRLLNCGGISILVIHNQRHDKAIIICASGFVSITNILLPVVTRMSLPGSWMRS